MRSLRAWLHRVIGVMRRNARERELQAELESHFQFHIDDNIRAGMSPDEARRTALLKFGPIESIKEDYRDRAGIPLLEILSQDARYALRRMRRQPGFTALVALTLALGAGANAAMFGLVDVLMFRTPRHVPNPQQIVRVDRAGTYVAYQELGERVRSLELTAYTRFTLSLGQGAGAIPLRAECVTPTYFAVAGAPPPLGRGFTAEDDELGAPRTVVLSHALWQSHFDADPETLGATVMIAGRPFEVIGIAPRGFTGLGLAPVDGWILLSGTPEACSFTGTNLLRSASGGWLTTVGRLREGTTLEQAAAEIAAMEAQVTARPKRVVDRVLVDESFGLTPLYASRRASLSADGRLALWLAGGSTALFLLACANIGGLLWIRTLDRRREIAVRLQLGASRRRVFAQILLEHLLIAAAGGAVAAIVGTWIGQGLRAYFPFAVDTGLLAGRTLVGLAVLAAAAGVLSGLAPALQASKAGAERFLRTGQTVAAPQSRMRGALLALQVGVALILVVAAGLFVASVDNYRRDFAYDLDRVIVAGLDFRRSGIRTPQEIRGIFDTLEARVRQLPQTERTALSTAPVLDSEGTLRIFPIRRSQEDTTAEMNALSEVSPDYFATLGLRLAAGRGFSHADRAGPPVVVINETLAAKLFRGEDPIGRPLVVGGDQREIIGVSRPFRASIRPDSQADAQVFVPLTDSGTAEMTPQVLLVRTKGVASAAVPAIAAALQGAAPDLPHISVRTLQELADVEAQSWLLGARVFGLFGTLAVILAGVGIYGALAFAIRQRTVELAVRMALGAMRRDIARLVLRHGAGVVATGMALGLTGAFVGSRYIQSLLFNVAPADPRAIATAVAVVVAAALAGCIVPAWRALGVDAASVLRTD